jgi:hypothetical protein
MRLVSAPEPGAESYLAGEAARERKTGSQEVPCSAVASGPEVGLVLSVHLAQAALSEREFVDGAIQFANFPAFESWCRLFGGVGWSSAGAPLPDNIARTAERFRAELSTVVHGRQTPEQLKAWRQTAKGVDCDHDYAIEGQHTRRTIWWRPPRQEVEIFALVTENPDARLATVLMWLLDLEQPYRALRECGLADKCDGERFFFRNRKFCCEAHRKAANSAPAAVSNRKADYLEREKAIKDLEPRFRRARELVWAVRKPGLKAEQLVKLAIERASEERKRRSPRKQK